jgi:hypothetical protein
MTTTSPFPASRIASKIALRRSGSACDSGPIAAPISRMISSGSSDRGLSLVTIWMSASSSAIRPMIGRLARSRSPPQPKTQMTSSSARSRAARRTFSSESGVCE